MTSWDFFDKMLDEANFVVTTSSSFWPSGEGYFRFSDFADRENMMEAMERVKNIS